MGPSLSLRDHASFIRPSTRERPATRDQGEHSLVVPSRTSSLHSRITQPIPSTLNVKSSQRTPKTLTHAYMVCGVSREPSLWVKAPPPSQGKIAHRKGAVPQFWLPEILGSSPKLEQDPEIARALHTAMRACFPHDVEICVAKAHPPCVHHSFVLQQDSSHTLYGIALQVWSRADGKRTETIREIRRKVESDFYESSDDTYWIPYCLSFLSRYPLYDILGDYLRGMWIHWNKATNLFHAEEVCRILSFPAPRLNDLVRIDMKDYALCYQFPSSPTGFQNFSLWPLFTCLSIPNIVGVIEAAVSATRRIIFVSHHPAILTIAAETIRFCVRVYEWSGLYQPIVHARHVNDLVKEPGPYILGVTAECRNLFTAPSDALVVDLDRNFVLTSSPPTCLSAGQRTKMINRLTQALNGEVTPSGVPHHLRAAYGAGKLVPAGQIIVMRGEVESIQDPPWWNQDNIMSVMDHVCGKLGRNTGMKAVFGGSAKKPLMTKVSMRHLNEIVRERNQYSRDAAEAWQDFINQKGRMDIELSKVTKRNNFLVEELESWKQQFIKFQSFAEQLTRETQDLKGKIESHKRENRRLTTLIDQQKDDAARLTVRLSGTEKQRDDALEALVLQQEIAEELERERKRNKKEISALQQSRKSIQRQRDEAQRVVVHLRSLISGQTHHMEHIIRTLNQTPEVTGYISSNFGDASDNDDRESIAGSEHSKVAGSLTSSRYTDLRKKPRRSNSLTSSMDGMFKNFDGEHVTPEMESHFFNSHAGNRSKRFSDLSMADVADRHLRDKTDAIADIIRNISDQCTAAVEGLMLAQDAEEEETLPTSNHNRTHISASDDGHDLPVRTTDGSEQGEGVSENAYNESSYLSPDSKFSSVPTTPDLDHHRSSTSMSINSLSTAPDRNSQQFHHGVSTKILHGDEASEGSSEAGNHEQGSLYDHKHSNQGILQPMSIRTVS